MWRHHFYPNQKHRFFTCWYTTSGSVNLKCYPFCRPLKSTVHYNVGTDFCESSFSFVFCHSVRCPDCKTHCMDGFPPRSLKDDQKRAASMTERLYHPQKIVALMKHKPIHYSSTSLLTFHFLTRKNCTCFGSVCLSTLDTAAAPGMGCHCGKPRGDLQIHGCRQLWKAPFSERFLKVKWAS